MLMNRLLSGEKISSGGHTKIIVPGQIYKFYDVADVSVVVIAELFNYSLHSIPMCKLKISGVLEGDLATNTYVFFGFNVYLKHKLSCCYVSITPQFCSLRGADKLLANIYIMRPSMLEYLFARELKFRQVRKLQILPTQNDAGSKINASMLHYVFPSLVVLIYDLDADYNVAVQSNGKEVVIDMANTRSRLIKNLVATRSRYLVINNDCDKYVREDIILA